MPMTQPGSLTSDEVYSLSAFILGEVDIIDTDMTLDKDSFADIVMPNADGFYPDPRPGTLLQRDSCCQLVQINYQLR